MKRLLLTAAVAVLALAAAAPVVGARGSGAAAGPLFGPQTEDGTVAIGRSHDGPVLAAAALGAGRPVEGSIRVWNDGSVPARLTLSAVVDGHRPLAAALRLRVTTAGGRLLYRGSFAGLGPTALGTFAPGEGETVRFRAILPPRHALPALDGRTLSAAFVWSAAAV